MSSNKSKITLITFVSITLIVVLIGFSGVQYGISNIRKKYIEQHLDLNQRTARTVSNLLSEQIEKGADMEAVLDMFQKAIAGSHINEGYLCMFDQKTAKLLCHPNTEMIGVKVDQPSYQFENLLENQQQILGEVVQSNKNEGGILTLKGENRSEITYMVPVKGTSWKVSVHENTAKLEANLSKLQNRAHIGFIILALITSILATIVARRVSASYERKIESQNEELEEQNEKIQDQKETIEEYASTLEDKVKERTVELQKANAKLRHLEKAKSDFLGIISHELRTPLNGIIGFTDILEHELQGTDHFESVQNIKISGQRLMNFSETALLITELTSQNTKLDFEEKYIRDIFRQTKKSFDKQLKDKNITLHQNHPEQAVLLLVVPELIQQCFHNILKNALKYTPEEGEIFVDCYKKNKDFICDIRDTGPGFSDEALSKLFDYFGADKVMNHSEGFGLGLAAANLIMEAHSGKIEVKNCEDEKGGAEVKLIFDNIIEK